MTISEKAQKIAPLSISQFNVSAEGRNVRLIMSFHNMHEWPQAVSMVEAMGNLGWSIDNNKSRQGSRMEVVVENQNVSTVVDRFHAMNVSVLRHS